jgi:N-acetylneuraminic acid mutarotase
VDFPSRNKLFAHLKICLVNRNPTNFIRTPDTDFFREHDAYLYVCGGRIRGKTLGFVERYNFATNTWEQMEGLKENRGSHVSAAVDNFVYVIGGGGFRSNLDSIERIDALSNERTTLAPLPCSRHALAAVTVDRSIYTIGGWIGGSISSTDLERYDVDSNTWTVLAPMPTGRRLLAACYHNQRIYTFGGNLRDEDKWNSDAMEI